MHRCTGGRDGIVSARPYINRHFRTALAFWAMTRSEFLQPRRRSRKRTLFEFVQAQVGLWFRPDLLAASAQLAEGGRVGPTARVAAREPAQNSRAIPLHVLRITGQVCAAELN